MSKRQFLRGVLYRYYLSDFDPRKRLKCIDANARRGILGGDERPCLLAIELIFSGPSRGAKDGKSPVRLKRGGGRKHPIPQTFKRL
jgi:hypothetical protein